MKNKNRNFKIIIVLLNIISLLTIGYVILRFDILPLTHSLLIILLITLVSLLLSIFYFKVSKKSLVILLSILILSITTLNIIVSFYLNNGSKVLKKITNTDNRETTISIVVTSESKFKSIDDLNGTVMYVTNETSQLVDQNDDYFNNRNIKVEKVENYIDLANKLLDETYLSIIIDEGVRSFIEENIQDFSDKSKVIDTFNAKITKNDITKNVDVKKESFSIYISGIDAFGDPSVSSRTDTNMILTMNPKTNQVLLTSIPRDYYIPIACQGGIEDKFTHSGIYGVDCSLQSLEQLLGIDINYYLRVNFTGFINVIDALGGVEVNSDYDFTSFNGYNFKKGVQTLNSAQALAFSRERKSLPNGDNDRIKNQQKVVEGIVRKLASPAMLTNFNSITNAIEGSIVTNMSNDNITSLVKLQLNKGSAPMIESIALNGIGELRTGTPYGGSTPLYIMIPYLESVSNAKAKISLLD